MDLTNNQRPNAGMIGIGGIVKVALLALAGIIFALGFSWFLRAFLLSGEWSQLIISTCFALGFLVVFTLQTFFIRSNMHFAIAFLLQSLGLMAFFLSSTVSVLVLFVVVYLLLLSASHGGRKILDNTLKIDFWNISKLVAPKGIIAMTLLVSVFIPLHLQKHRDQLPLSLATFDKVLASSNVFIKRFYQDFDSSQTVEQMARAATERQLATIPQAKNLSPREREVLIGRSVQDFYEQLSGYTGVKIDPKQPVSVVAYGVLQDRYNRSSDDVKLWIYIIFGSIVFVSIASIMMPIRILVALLAFLAYETMIALGFAHVIVESRSKEVLILD